MTPRQLDEKLANEHNSSSRSTTAHWTRKINLDCVGNGKAETILGNGVGVYEDTYNRSAKASDNVSFRGTQATFRNYDLK